jgi:hypothetical protein
LKGKRNPKKIGKKKEEKDSKKLNPMPGLTVPGQTCSLCPVYFSY